MEESADMAESAIIYKNVADGLDTVEESTDSIISTMKAFGIESNDTMGIIDRFNEVGNRFAITSGGIGEALQRSASALYEAGNSIDESIGLITAANSVIQNPEQVGTALKTLALRLRGTKTELEDAGEDVDGMAESTSQLQAKLKALTHGKVDIMVNADEFKNTTEILREMSQAWGDMTDIEKASALELMGGKRQANILASVIKNFDTVEKVIQTSQDSQGSAIKENEKYLDSIQGRIDVLTNSMQTLWNNTLNSDVLKFFLDLGNDVVNVVNKIGLLPTALAGVAFYFTAIKKNNPVTMFKDLSASVQNYGQALNQVRAIQSLNKNVDGSDIMDSKKFNSEHIKAYGMAVEGLSQKQQIAALATAGLTKEQIAQAIGVEELTDANFNEALAEAQVTTEKKKSVIVSGSLILADQKRSKIKLSATAQNWLEAHSEEEITEELLAQAVAKGQLERKDAAAILMSKKQTQANMQENASLKGLVGSIKNIIKQNPVMFMTIIATVLTGLISKIEMATDRTEKLKDAYNELQSSISNIEGEISSLDSELNTLQEQINELQNQDSLSLVEAEELQRLKEQSAELEHQKQLQETLLKARKKEEKTQSLTMINNLLKTTAANQEAAAKSGEKWGKAIGAVLGIIGGVAAVALAPFTGGGSLAAAGVGLAASLSGAGSAALTAGFLGSQIGSGLGGKVGEWAGGKLKESGDSLIEWYESYEKALDEAEQQASKAEKKYINDVSDKNYEEWQKKVEAVNTLQTEMYDNLEEMQGYISNLEYNDQTAGIIDSYNNLMTHLDVKSNGNSIDAQISSIESLKEEYNELSRGVDENGNNIALTSEEYARYCSIVEQILGYTPQLIKGYDSEGNAILNRNTLLSDSIELLKEQQRLEAQKATNDENIVSAYDAAKDNRDAQAKSIKKVKPDNGFKTIGGKSNRGHEIADIIGVDFDFTDNLSKYIAENADAVASNYDKIMEKAKASLDEEELRAYSAYLKDIFAQLQYVDDEMNQFKQTLYLVPQSSTSYNDLSGSSLEFINDYIASLENLDNKSEEEIIQIRNNILTLTDTIAQSPKAQELIDKLFTLDPSSIPVQEYKDSINEIFEQLISEGIITEEQKESLYEQLMPDVKNIDAMQKEVQKKLQESSKGLIKNLTLPELKIAYKYVLEEADDSLTFEELKQKIAEYNTNVDIPIVQTYSVLQEQIEKFNETSLQTSKIVLDNTKVTQDYKDALTDLGISGEDLAECFDATNSLVVTNAKKLNNLVKSAKKNTVQNVQLAKSQARLKYYELYKEMSGYISAEGKIVKGTTQQILSLYQEMNAVEKTIARYSMLEAQLLGTTNAYEKFQQAQEIDSETDYIGNTEDMVLALGKAFNTAELGTETAQAAIAGLVPPSVYEDLDTLDEKMGAIYNYFKKGKIAQYFHLEFDDDGSISSAEMKLGNLRKFIEDGLANGVFTGSDWQHFDLSKEFDGLEEGADKLQYLADKMNVTKDVAFAFFKSLEDHDIEWLNGDYSSILEDLLPESFERDIYNAMQDIAGLNAKLADGSVSAEEYAKQFSALSKELEAAKKASRENMFGSDGVADKSIQQVNEMDIDSVDGYFEANQKVANAQAAVTEATKKQIDAEKALNEARNDSNITDSELKKLESGYSETTKEVLKCDTALQKAIEKRDQFAQPTEMEIQVALDDIEQEIANAGGKFDKAIAENFDIDENGYYIIKTDVDLTQLEAKYPGIKKYVDLLNSKTQLDAYANTGEAEASLQDVVDSINEIIDSLNSIQLNLDKKSAEQLATDVRETIANLPKDAVVFVKTLFTGKNGKKTNETGDVDATEAIESSSADENNESMWTKIDTFFNETIPEKWSQLWDSVGGKIDEIQELAEKLKAKIAEFFTITIPEKWNEFWDAVGEKIDVIKEKAGVLQEKVGSFFTETIPEKWDEFWDAVKKKFNDVKSYAGILKKKVVDFFTVTIPAKWDEFWDAVGYKIDDLKANGEILKQKVVDFFTTTIPAKWDEFWDAVGAKIDDVKADAEALKQKVADFFTVTIPAKWTEFWDGVGAKIDELKAQAEVLKTKVSDFFMVTIPAKWNEFWGDVGDFITETLPQGIEAVKTGISTFFTVTLPGKINGLWDEISSWISQKASDFWNNLFGGFKAGANGDKYNSGQNGGSGVNGTAHVHGTAHSSGNWGLSTSEHNALVGEIAPEMVVDPATGRYYTVGDNGAEMVDLPKGAIIFNHKQTEDLLKHGYVTSRGKMLANGTAHAEGNAHVTIYPNGSSKQQWSGTGYSGPYDSTYDLSDALSNAADSLSSSADSLSDATDEFEEVFDWIEVRLSEIDSTLDFLDSKLENAATYYDKNKIIDQMISVNNTKMNNLMAGLDEYSEYASRLLSEVPSKYRDAAQNGAIAIEEFEGEADEATVEAIKNYREWADKVADINKELEETKTRIRDLAINKFNNAYETGKVKATVEDSQTEKLQNRVDLDETRGLVTSDAYYVAMMENSNRKIEYLTSARNAMQKELDKAVQEGSLVRGSDEWYELVDQMYQIDAQIDEATIELEEFQNAINDIYWDNFENLTDQLDYLSNETQSLIDLMESSGDLVDENGNWTDEGITSLGLYAQQMEIAEYSARQYAEAIDDLNRDYKAGKYSESEYLEKLNDLKDKQYDAIQTYYDAQDAIVDLNKTRIDAVKDGIQKEIDAYEKLIKAKKDELSAEKD